MCKQELVTKQVSQKEQRSRSKYIYDANRHGFSIISRCIKENNLKRDIFEVIEKMNGWFGY